ncbi:DUF2778 domain-containing protein [Dyella sp. M7H15-1]|nr:DUF2778 domain-containing protein [Dyella sp. M7H15-1]
MSVPGQLIAQLGIRTALDQPPRLRKQPVNWGFRLSGQYMSSLHCESLGSFPAYSGRREGRNNRLAITKEAIGPIPPGRYYIVDRESGGRMGWMRDVFASLISGSDRSTWFALWNCYRCDSVMIEGIRRGQFRLHAAGYEGLSEGCITLPSLHDFMKLHRYLRSAPPDLTIPGGALKAYGFIEVI